MRTLTLTRRYILFPILVWWILFEGLSAYNFNPLQLLNIVGFLFLIIVPGLLTVLAMKLKGLNFWGHASFIVGFSLLELMLIALLGNTFLPYIGIARPLDKGPLLLEVYLLIAILFIIVWRRVKQVEIPIRRYAIFDNLRDIILSFAPIAFVVLSILGTISLNDGGSNIWTMIMLGSMGLYIILLIYYAKDLDENTLPTAIFFMSLSLLLMTSLRGWYITGHDIQSEYKVFELAKTAGLWSIAVYRDAYNACLSITILPTVFSSLLRMPDPYIYKFFFQIFFAICPVLVYQISRQWTNRLMSFLATIYFIAFPNFFTDMPFLIRQEVAFLFFGLMLYIIFNPNLKLSTRRWLFMIMGVGVILSHYSTTYTVLVIFGIAVISRPLFIKLLVKFKDKPLLKDSALLSSPAGEIEKKPKITFVMIAVLFILSFLWTSIITNTGGQVTIVIRQTYLAVVNGFAGENRSIDAINLLSFSKANQNQELQDYITTVIDPIRDAASPGEYYSTQSYSQYTFTALPDESAPLTWAGKFLERFGINAGNLIADFGQLLAKLIEVLVPLGMVYLLFRKSIVKYIDSETYLISFYCLVFIFLNIVLPVLSAAYGIFRAMQQSMFIIAPIIVIASEVVGAGFISFVKKSRNYFLKKDVEITGANKKRNGEIFGMVLAVIFFFYSTAFIPQLFGGNDALLHLNNTGRYYDDLLIQTTEVAGVNWLTNIATANSNTENGVRLAIQTDQYSSNKFASITDLSPYNDIFPGVIRRDDYVFLGPGTVLKQRATIVYNADQVTYQYPIQFLSDNKDLIYNNGGAEIYK